MWVPRGGLVARRRGHGRPGGGHDVAGLGGRVLGEHGGGRGRLIHGWSLWVLAGALPTQGHLAELGGQLLSLRKEAVSG